MDLILPFEDCWVATHRHAPRVTRELRCQAQARRGIALLQ
jgi:hypothetical protein